MWGQTKYPFTETEIRQAKVDIQGDIERTGWDAETKKRVTHLVLVVIGAEHYGQGVAEIVKAFAWRGEGIGVKEVKDKMGSLWQPDLLRKPGERDPSAGFELFLTRVWELLEGAGAYGQRLNRWGKATLALFRKKLPMWVGLS